MSHVLDVRAQIAATELRRTQLAHERALVQAALDENLARSDRVGPRQYDGGLARAQRAELAQFDGRLGDLDARLAALTRELPTAGDVAAAEAALETQAAAIARAQTTYDAALLAHVQALDVAEQAARAFDAARTTLRTVLFTMADTVAGAGLDPQRVPPVPTVAAALITLTQLQGWLVGTVAQGAIDPQVERELAAAVMAARAPAAA